MPKFTVTIGRDATVYYTATVEAESLDAVKERVGRHGFQGKDEKWSQSDVQTYDEVESAEIEEQGSPTSWYWDKSTDWVINE